MPSLLHAPDQQELLGVKTSFDSESSFIYDNGDYELEIPNHSARSRKHLSSRFFIFLRRLLIRPRVRRSHTRIVSRKSCLSRLLAPRTLVLCRVVLCMVLVLIVLTGIFRPSYTHLPPHYESLKARYLLSQDAGRANPWNEQIFITCALYDKNGHLAGGKWGKTILDLVDILGPTNVFLSIYENDSGDTGSEALHELGSELNCEHEIVSEMHVPVDPFPTITLQDGSVRHKRIPYLSEMRNRALRPLDRHSNRTYDKVLILNDVFFNPIDAAQLLFSTNIGEKGRPEYTAACAVDFINPFKFYDTYATRDLAGYSMGVPFYPWFSSAGQAQSRHDVLDQKDSVRVKSCWGGMVAFDAKYLQSNTKHIPAGFEDIGAHTISPYNPKPVSAPVRFRAEPEVYFDACECCLLHADVLRISSPSAVAEDSGIYLNPFVRVAYSSSTLSWLSFTRRFERLYSIVQWIVNTLARMPTYNAHRAVEEGELFQEEVWVGSADGIGGGSWQVMNRTARNGLYCGVREMQILLKKDRKEDKNWMNTQIPRGRRLW
ncbi:hypothetical protein MMC19_005890 [Ptychographa xylographoides]|nr:hypothetical protein [Ptychographa xylographoides]